ncbi:MAG: excinuclease ABC subunit UvrA [Spirochaetales bacterium]|nr:excinuclease ABC subunit UvrA [Spirochaetales bacterium]
MDKIVIKGARVHNLKNISLEIPRDKLVIVSGLSGSGKSSLAFDTIYAEGQRRYVESLSAYARQFLGTMDKPDVDYIEGLSPAISIEQKTTHKNPRSTVGTVTEIYDYYRLLFARIGIPHCPECGKEIKEQSVDQIIDTIVAFEEGSKIMILAPVVRGRKGEHRKIFEDAKAAGFARARIDGEIVELEIIPELDKNKKHDIEIIVDRVKISNSVRQRVSDSIETAIELTDGIIFVTLVGDEGADEFFFSTKAACSECGFSMPELQPRLFSFNNPFGACPECSGLGEKKEFSAKMIAPDHELSFNEHGFLPFKPTAEWYKALFSSLARELGFSLDTKIKDYPDGVLDKIFNGYDGLIDFIYERKDGTGKYQTKKAFPGIIAELKRRYYESGSSYIKEWLESFMKISVCPACHGKRLRPEALSVLIAGKNISDVTAMSVKDSIVFFENLDLSETEILISSQILKEIKSRLSFLKNVGLEYLNLERKSGTLSGGEAQRIRLATQIGSQLVGVLYILDEPSIGLHQRDNQRLIDTLLRLRDVGNTVIVVEHDEQTMLCADYLIDLGPGAGIHGGEIVCAGTPEQVKLCPESVTGAFLSRRITIDASRQRRIPDGRFIEVLGATENNLKNIDVRIPLGLFTVITGVSGSGKSSLLEQIIFPCLSNRVNRSNLDEGAFSEIKGHELIDKVINIDQSPIGRTPRSNPATYVGVFTPIRELFAQMPESRLRGYAAGRFSFNVKGGRCEICEGDGTKKIEMHFLPDVYVTCESCKGKRYNKETLEVRFKGKNINDILHMSVDEACEFFENQPKILNKLQTLSEVGLGYIKLGQSALTLSGGEAQRVKLSAELAKRSTGKTFYIIDEPTTGLHFADVKKLLEVLQLLVDKGNTVVLIEHDLDVIKQADYVIDLGPDGGDAGGYLVCEGTPEEVAKSEKSYTGKFLKQVFDCE